MAGDFDGAVRGFAVDLSRPHLIANALADIGEVNNLVLTATNQTPNRLDNSTPTRRSLRERIQVSKRLSKLKAMIAAFAVITASLAVAVGISSPASATVPRFNLATVRFDLADPSDLNRISYSNFLGSVRAYAGGGPDVGNVYMTQPRGDMSHPNGLIMLIMSAPNEQGGTNTVLLWMNPNDLYIMGFTNQAGTTYAFNDQAAVLRNVLSETGGGVYGTAGIPSWVNRDPISLAFGGTYGSLSRPENANRSLEDIQFGWFDIQAAIQRLGTVTSPGAASQRQWVARSLQTIIQFTSEAARFNDVMGMWRSAMTNYEQRTPLTARWHDLETDWSSMSRYLHYLTDNPNATDPGHNVGGSFGTIHGAAEVSRYLLMGLRTTGLHEPGSATEL
ncbi:ribosome-inactivating family protein [Micromonospora lupini]|uniref:ribosome-inactivating family protein n=1 Tax=Micromonospora lupini TaxID=285679 RepID=UPI0034040B73